MNIVFRDVREDDFEWLYDLRKKTMPKYIIASDDQFNRDSQSDRIMKEFSSIKIVLKHQ